MIDSVLKGTGNSRFLKSAVPAGTSWADALAMLQAGTFPIDFNGINTEGFQQVGTPLNKANLLKDATAAQIGLPPSTTPDGMFQALGNTGDLHVWRKTTVSTEPVPAGYKLGKIISSGNATDSGVSITGGYTNAGKVHINRFSAVNVSDDGTVTGDTSATGYSSYPVGQTVPNFDVGGYFLSLTETVNGTIWASEIEKDKIYYVPVGSSWFQGPGPALRFCLTSIQEVIGTPYIPAGTTTTYPVSTNPKAYQEGDDAKEAGYVVGDSVNVLIAEMNAGTNPLISYAQEISVADNGEVSLGTTGYGYIRAASIESNFNSLRGKFIQTNYSTGSTTEYPDKSLIFFIPLSATLTYTSSGSNRLYRVDCQPVTGYAAIPAGTTIEYLGRLGDKARVQVVSYVGTGTYGESNPCSISADFPIKVILFISYRHLVNNSDDVISSYFTTNNYTYDVTSMWLEQVSTNYKQYTGIGREGNYGKKSNDGRTYYWYSTSDAYEQGNNKGNTYTFLVIG